MHEFYPDIILRVILMHWEVYNLTLSYISEPHGRNYEVYIFYNMANGSQKFIHHLN